MTTKNILLPSLRPSKGKIKIHIPTISEKSGLNVLLFLVRWKFFYTKCENEQWHSYIIFWYMECYKNLSAGLGKTSGGETVRYKVGGWVGGSGVSRGAGGKELLHPCFPSHPK